MELFDKIHANLVLKMGVILFSTKKQSVSEIGICLNELHSDDLTSGGYWLYDWETNECYYSEKLINSLGYNRCDVQNNTNFFYKVADNEHLNEGFKMIDELVLNKSELSFINDLNYTHKNGSIIKVECSGTVFYKFNEPIIVLGTHILL
jgi:hypothetical protein